MKIKLLTDLCISDGVRYDATVHRAGEIIDLPEEEARWLLAVREIAAADPKPAAVVVPDELSRA